MARGIRVELLLLLSLAFAGGAVAAHLKAGRVSEEASRVGASSVRAGEAFVATFDGSEQDRELSLLDQRRQLLHEASVLRRATLFGALLSVLFGFAFWVVRQLRAVQEIVDGAPVPGRPQSGGSPMAPSRA